MLQDKKGWGPGATLKIHPPPKPSQTVSCPKSKPAWSEPIFKPRPSTSYARTSQSSPTKHGTHKGSNLTSSTRFTCISPLDLHCHSRRLDSPLMALREEGLNYRTDLSLPPPQEVRAKQSRKYSRQRQRHHLPFLKLDLYPQYHPLITLFSSLHTI